ncbi:hypothetical protein ABN16_11725 [Levilactobacillus koreensis]|uniref:Uncharacterized protein n=1 Tax=Levilactobacillus koreensis TaxID=637971 RepID=A0AAC8UXW4_9LACO|nr:hypothetical protein ABN16_11725 [Levilactobacillus koreensis]
MRVVEAVRMRALTEDGRPSNNSNGGGRLKWIESSGTDNVNLVKMRGRGGIGNVHGNTSIIIN